MDETETLTVTYSGPDPAQAGSPLVATFQQGSLPAKQENLLSSASLGNNSFNAYFQVPMGMATDAGVITVPTTLILTSGSVVSPSRTIQVAPPPSLSAFPQEVYVGDVSDNIHIHGSNTHFDSSTTASGGTGLQVTSVVVISSTDLIATLKVSATSATSSTLSITSGASDPKTLESVHVPLSISPIAAPVFGAQQLAATDAPPGAVVQIQGLFYPQDSASHNTIEWTIAGESFVVRPMSETSSTLNVMVPLWPNPDGTIYSGPVQLQVNVSGKSSQFNFTIDALPANPNSRGTVFSSVLSSLANSVPTLQPKLAEVSSSPQSAGASSSVASDIQSLVTQLQQFVNSEAAGTPSAPPGGSQVLSTQGFDLIEQLLLTSGVYGQAFGQSALTQLSHPGADSVTTEGAMLSANAACTLAGNASTVITQVESVLILASVAAAASSGVTGPVGVAIATALLSAAATLDDLSDAVTVLSALCEAFPVSIVSVVFNPTSLNFPSLPGGTISAQSTSLTANFSGCANPIAPLISIFEELLDRKLKRLLSFLPIGTFLDQIEKKLITFAADELVAQTSSWLSDTLSKYLGTSLPSATIAVPLTDLSVTLLSQNPSVAMSLGYLTQPSPGFSIQPVGPGTTNLFGQFPAFNMMSDANTDCQSLTDATKLTGNALGVTESGPPVAIPTNSGGGTGVIPVVLGGKPIDKAYVAIPGSSIVSVVNADASAGATPLSSIAMPAGFSPTATSANPTNLEVDVISYTSATVVRVDASTDAVKGTISLPVTTSQTFSGGTCMVCGVVADPIANQFIFDTASGYFIFDVRQNQIVQRFTDHTAENFGYDPVLREIVNPYYSPAFSPTLTGVDLLSLPSNTVAQISPLPSALFKPDGAAVDYTTHVAVVANEAENVAIGSLTFLNLAPVPQGQAGTLAIPFRTYTFPDASGACSGGGDSSEWTMLAIDPNTHLLFFANEFSNCAGVLDLPPIRSDGTPSAAVTVRYGAIPTSPDGQPWNNSHDPHGTAVFVSVVDGKSYGFLTRLDGAYVARIDLRGVYSASQVTGGAQNQIDLTPYVTFLRTQ